MKVNTVILADSGYKYNSEVIERAVKDAVSHRPEEEIAEVVVSLVSEAKMKRLHRKYMRTWVATDVLSFPLELDTTYPDKVIRLGDVVICYPVAVRQAAINHRSVNEEIAFLTDHGCKHLLGHHHE